MQIYPVLTIPGEENIDACMPFQVANIQWNSRVHPVTIGHMGYLPHEGLLVFMKCYEQNPLRTMTQNMDPVCLDSAMEAFFAFPERAIAEHEAYTPDDNGLYLNFECNANGAMYATYGHGRQGRTALLPEEFAAARPRVRILPDSWELTFLVPMRLLSRVADIQAFSPGDVFYCNFYKISETPEIEHYLSFSPITSERPNFHLPRFFAKAVIR